jgi:hypothetical protein
MRVTALLNARNVAAQWLTSGYLRWPRLSEQILEPHLLMRSNPNSARTSNTKSQHGPDGLGAFIPNLIERIDMADGWPKNIIGVSFEQMR